MGGEGSQEKDEGRMVAELIGKSLKAKQDAPDTDKPWKRNKNSVRITPGLNMRDDGENYGGTVSVVEAIVLYSAIAVSALIYVIWGMVNPDPISIFSLQGDPRMPVWIVFAGAGMFAISALRLIPWKGVWLLLRVVHKERGSDSEKRLGAEFAKQSYSVFAIGVIIFLFLGYMFIVWGALGMVARPVLENEICGGAVSLAVFALGIAGIVKFGRYIEAVVRPFYLETQKLSLGLRMFYTMLFIALVLLPFTFSIFTFGAMTWISELFFLSIFIGAITTAIDLPLVLGIERGIRWMGMGMIVSAMFYLPALLGWMNQVELPVEMGGVYGAVLLASVASSFMLGFLRKGEGGEDNATAAISLLASLAYIAQPVEQNAIIVATILGMAALIYFRARKKKPVSAKQ